MKLKKIILSILSVVLLISFSACDFSLLEYVDPDFKPDMYVHFLDVGQGDSTFIELPNGETMLIDAAENYHGSGIIDYISNLGYDKIDYLVATHPHADHIGSMPYVIRNIDVGVIYMPKVTANTKLYEELLKSIKSRKVKSRVGKAGVSIIDEDDLAVDIIAPKKIDEENLNNSSIVIRIYYRDAGFLFLGDAEKAELETISDDMFADVLKVGHHGSSTSTTKELLEKVKPQIAVISCGVDNSYGHPHKSTLKLLGKLDCDVYRTDEDMTVTVSTDGKYFDVKTGVHAIAEVKK